MKQVWAFAAGRRHVNRVRVYQREGWRIRMVARGVDVNLGHRDRARAAAQAIAKAEEIREPRSVRKHANIMRVRQDLVRVARGLGLPEGIAPTLAAYRKLGAFGEGFVQGQHVGYVKAGGTREQWCDSMKRYGLKPFRDAMWSPGGPGRVAADVKRVALKLGRAMRMPTAAEYERHGKWARNTAMDWHGAPNWSALARMLGLTMDGRKPNQHTTKANTGTQRSAA